MTHDIIILGIFVADTSYRAERLPRMGETILGKSFVLGPGGKGSNQAVAAARAGGNAAMLTKLGKDPFADIALDLWREAGVTSLATQHEGEITGAAFIFIQDEGGDNAIIVSPGVAGTISPDDLGGWKEDISSAKVFITQLEQPMDAAHRGLEIARKAGVKTILNPAPAAPVSDEMLALCDFITPNETEAEALTGVKIDNIEDAAKAADVLMAKGVGAAIITLGKNGAFYSDGKKSFHAPGASAGPVVETTGAGDAFNGALAAGLAEGMTPEDAISFANAAAALSVTRPGAAASSARREEIDRFRNSPDGSR